MSHDEYWKAVWTDAHARLNHLFEGCRHKVEDIVGDDDGIDTYADAKKVLAHAWRCADTNEEKACATLSVMEALQAVHELKEHSAASAAK